MCDGQVSSSNLVHAHNIQKVHHFGRPGHALHFFNGEGASVADALRIATAHGGILPRIVLASRRDVDHVASGGVRGSDEASPFDSGRLSPHVPTQRLMAGQVLQHV
jgi:hypothetical protein